MGNLNAKMQLTFKPNVLFFPVFWPSALGHSSFRKGVEPANDAFEIVRTRFIYWVEEVTRRRKTTKQQLKLSVAHLVFISNRLRFLLPKHYVARALQPMNNNRVVCVRFSLFFSVSLCVYGCVCVCVIQTKMTVKFQTTKSCSHKGGQIEVDNWINCGRRIRLHPKRWEKSNWKAQGRKYGGARVPHGTLKCYECVAVTLKWETVKKKQSDTFERP